MKKLNVLIIADKQDMESLDINKQSDRWNVYWEILHYDEIYNKIESLKKTIVFRKIHFVVFSRNDQVGKLTSIGPVISALKVGYTTISGIDQQKRVEQMCQCFLDFMEGDTVLPFDDETQKKSPLPYKPKGTFSLVFDTEQLGGVRYGIPRIFKVLNIYGIKATFFITNLMQWIYPGIVDKIVSKGHEIGIHGRYHEYLSTSDERKQCQIIEETLDDFKGYSVFGANFIGRMDEATLASLTQNGIKYFVYPLIHDYATLGFRKYSTLNTVISVNRHNLIMVPISVETYGLPWIMIRGMLESVLKELKKNEYKHLTILLHPFRDGNISHIGVLEKIIKFLYNNDLISLPIADKISAHNAQHNADCATDINVARAKRKLFQFPMSLTDIKYAPVGIGIKMIQRVRPNTTVF
ncbi:MAG: polysaccharide deacetylase family protein [Planctomycetes bacterium]|nr:polysaccharide deacetylase family protein [Planctomycetota bacterium]